MKKITLKLFTLIIALFSIATNANAQTTVTINSSSAWNGYVNCFDLSNSYLWGSAWALADVKSTVSSASVTVQPNFNTYNATDPYWSNGAIGNKNLELLTYVEPTIAPNQNLTFTGYVTSNTLSSGYTREAFIKVLDPANGYATVVNQLVTLPASGLFSVTAFIPNTPGLVVQYGFRVYGLNANPIDEAALGSVVAVPYPFPMSLKLYKFSTTLVSDVVHVNWETSNEKNVKGFEIQKSTDGRSFETLAFIDASNKLNNEYEIIDNNFLNTAYYRLKMIDEDGEFSYSDIEKVVKLYNDEVNLYPNPSSNSINIISKKQSAIIYSIFGNAIQKIKLNDGITNIDISALNSGNYFIQFSKGQVVNFTKK